MNAILMYHSLDSSESPISLSPALFRRQMEWLAGSGIPVVPLAQAATVPGAIALTFDDAFANLLDHAIPVLEQYRLPATIFVVSGHCGRSNDWPGQPACIPKMPLMTWAQLRALPRSCISLGAHTVTHPDLTTLAEHEQIRELHGSRSELEDQTGDAVLHFAYPYGASTPALRGRVRQHFRQAYGTALRYLGNRDDGANLPRIDAYYLRHWPLERLLTGPGQCYLAFRRMLRGARRAVRR